MAASYILSIDQGTTSSRAILFDQDLKIVATDQREFKQIFPQSGWVEHDASEIWETQLSVITGAMAKADVEATDIAGIGITNQRETTVVWDRATGKPIHHAIVWQDRRTASYCDELRNAGHADMIKKKTGLVLDAYFSGTKVKYILDNVDGARERARRGELAFGTIDSWLVYKLTGGKSHITDASNASRTMLYNIHSGEWDDDLLDLLNVPKALLPTVVNSSGLVAETSIPILGAAVPISGIAGDQQAALFGQLCTEAGMAKNTYGTGCFMVANTGDTAVESQNSLLTTIAWQIDGKTTYALEGSVFVAGSAIQWLRDGLQIIDKASESEALAENVEDSDGVVFVPALTGLGAPYWDSYARGTIVGISRGTTRAHIVRAALEGIAYQVRDVVDAMTADFGKPLELLRVDGGAAMNGFLMQTQADYLQCPVEVASINETTALGAALLAGLAVGYWDDLDQVKAKLQPASAYQPQAKAEEINQSYEQWQDAVRRSRGWVKE
jgi:glycerol kinase